MLQVGEGELLKLRPPFPGELLIKVEAQSTGSPLTMGVHNIPPGGEIAVHRYLSCDRVLFVHKGQGRTSVEGQVTTVVPGIAISVPRQTWFGVRNTGNGVLQLAWVSMPKGVEDYFRELSRLSGPADPAALQMLAGRYGIEFHPSGEGASASVQTPAPGQQRRRRHRGGRGRGRGTGQARQSPPSPQPQVSAAPPTAQPTGQPPASPVALEGAARRERPRGRRRRRGGAPPRAVAASTAGPPPAPKAATPAAPASLRPQRHHHRRVKEVYMGGRWVQVTGEGPVIDAGHERQGPGRKSSGSDDPPARPLSVSL